MAWRIEKAKTDRSVCRVCSKQIAQGEYRFGNDDLNAFWYHLACAPDGKPRAFKRFAKQAEKLLAATPKKAAKPKPAGATIERNAELEARLLADPSGTRAVFADWLQSHGDPWGELIALTAAGKKKEAKAVLKEHAESLMGGYAPKQFEWRDGFVDTVRLGSTEHSSLPAILGLRTVVLLRRLYLARDPDPETIAAVSELAPKNLRKLFTRHGDAIAKLAVPSLHRLSLWIGGDRAPTAKAWGPLFAGKTLPKLRHLEMYDNTVSTAFLDALIDSPLFEKLEGFELHQAAIDAPTAKLLIARKPDLAHLTYVHFTDGEPEGRALEEAYAAQIEAANTIDRYDD